MKLASYRRINKSDYTEEQRQLIEKLADSLNVGIDNVYLALNNRLTRRENMVSTEKDLTVLVDENGLPRSPLFFDVSFTGKVYGLSVEKVDALTNTVSYPLGAVMATWTQSGARITINHLTGLRPGIEYRIHVVANG